MQHKPRRVHQPATQLVDNPAALAHGAQSPIRVVLHDTESPDAGLNGMKGIVSYWANSTPGYGAHLIIDKDGHTVRVVADMQEAWHTGGCNTGSLGIEQVGYGSFKTRQWYTRPRQLVKVARWLAWWSHLYGIPVVPAVFDARIGQFGSGVLTHAMASAHFSASQGHSDPGPGYPLGFVLRLARAFKKFGW